MEASNSVVIQTLIDESFRFGAGQEDEASLNVVRACVVEILRRLDGSRLTRAEIDALLPDTLRPPRAETSAADQGQ